MLRKERIEEEQRQSRLSLAALIGGIVIGFALTRSAFQKSTTSMEAPRKPVPGKRENPRLDCWTPTGVKREWEMDDEPIYT